MAVALRHPTAIMVQCMRVNATLKCRRAASFFDMCSQNRRRLFLLHRRDVCAVSVLVSKHFFRYRYRIDTAGIGRYRVPDAGIGLTLVKKGMIKASDLYGSYQLGDIVISIAEFATLRLSRRPEIRRYRTQMHVSCVHCSHGMG